MTSRDKVFSAVRTALGRYGGFPPAPPPPLMCIPETPVDQRIRRFCEALQNLNGKTYVAPGGQDACRYVFEITQGREAVASNAPFLAECGITGLAGVRSGVSDRLELRELCARAPVGITSADYALAETGTLVMLSSQEEARMVSLLPPVHVAVVPVERLLTGLDELLTLLPVPSRRTSSMVLITGPSRTADIEQILVRGVHGPGQIHVVLVE